MEQKWETAPRRAWGDTKKWLLGSFIAWILVTLVIGVISAIFIPVENTLPYRAMAGLIGVVVAILLIVIITYLIHLILAPLRQRNEARLEVQKIINRYENEPKPNLQMVNKPYIDERTISLTTGSQGIIKTPLFAHVKFRNVPNIPCPESNANKVYPEVTYYDTKLIKVLKTDNVRFSDMPQPAFQQLAIPQRQYYEVEFNANGNPHELTIALKYKEDRYCYAFSDRSCIYESWKKPEYLLKGDKFYVKVNLNGENTSGEWWFGLCNKGIGDSLELEPIPAPILDKEGYPSE
jgi:hypothetical protein